MADVTLELVGQQCRVDAGFLDWRIQHDLAWVEAQPPVEIGYPPTHAQITEPVGVVAAPGPLAAVPSSYAGVQSDGDVLNWRGKRRSFQVQLQLRSYAPVLGVFSTAARVGVCLASDPLDGLGFLAVHAQWEDRVPGNIPDLAHISIGAKTWTLEAETVPAGVPDRRIQIVVDFSTGAAAVDGRWGAYWVGFVSDHNYEFPEFPGNTFPGQQIEWLLDGNTGGDPVDGRPPLGYLFPSGYVPDAPLVVYTGLGVHMSGVDPLGCSTRLITRREQFSYSLGWDANINHLPDGFLAWDEEGPDSWVIRPAGKQLTVYRNQFDNMNLSLVGQQATLARGTLVPFVGAALLGQQIDTMRGVMLPRRDTFVALTGRQATTARGAFVFSVGQKLVGKQLTTARGALGPATAVRLTGRALQVRRGMFPGLAVSLPLTGLQATVAQGTLAKGVGIALTGKTLTVQRGALAKGLAPSLAGRQVTVKAGKLTPGRSSSLAGHSLSISQGSLHVAVAVRLTGQQCGIVQGVLGRQVDGITALKGMALRVMAGEFPIKPVPPEGQLFVQQENTDVFIDEEPAA